ncbi:MAG: M15 family metallopeptidase [Gammaproteobacteria bacterium]|nr:M15 family metallopeptidase [Gammaproteobacteria bacterium]
MSEFVEKLKIIHKRFGIPADYETQFGLIPQREPFDLQDIENDIYGRCQKLVPPAAVAWKQMKNQAHNEQVSLNVVSAFRSIDKQIEIIQRKVDAGQLIADILQVSAAPGYSEHHTGRAIDLTTEGCAPLTEAFEKTLAFKWLQENAQHFSFSLSYPKDNKCGIAYEPWHWAYSEGYVDKKKHC